MSFERLAGGAVLVDDVLLDPTDDTITAAAFGGPPLSRVSLVLRTGDTGVHVPGIATFGPGHGGAAGFATGHATVCGDGWLLDTTTEGLLLHCPTGTAQVPVGARLTVVNPSLDAPHARSNRRVLVTGGSRSGKSGFAEELVGRLAASASGSVEYVATGPRARAEDSAGRECAEGQAGTAERDDEWAARIAAHRARRPRTWRTCETLDVAGVLDAPGDPVLVDGLGTWVSGTLDGLGWEGDLADARGEVLRAFASTARDVVVVTDEVGDGVVPEHASGRLFRDELGLLNAQLAQRADEVWRVTAGIPTRLR